MGEQSDSVRWDDTFDVVVVGSGAGGLSTALVAATLGSRVLVAEKTAYFGGGCAVSGGVVWIPDNPEMAALGISDTQAAARHYLQSVLGPRARWDLIDAYLEQGPQMLRFLHTRTSVRLVPRVVAPDYYAETEGAAAGGRMLDPAVFDGRTLGPLFARLRPPLPSFLLLGGMMVGKADITALLSSYKSFGALRHAAGLVLRYFKDRLSYPRGTRLVVGNALAATLLKAASESGAELWSEASVTRLIQQEGRICGVVVEREGRMSRIRARRGVVLATGGAPGSADFARANIPFPELHRSMAPATNCGDGIRLGLSVGGRLDEVNEDNAFWTPVSTMTRADGSQVSVAHLISDRQKPGLIAVNHSGNRFTNESVSYHDFVVAMHAAHRETPTIPAYFVCDARFIRRYGLGLVRPGPASHRRFLESGYLVRGRDLDDLAAKLAVPAANLRKAVDANNRYAVTGVDEEFGRGTSAYHRYLGDPDNHPNPCIGPIQRPPFFAVRVYPGDIGTSLGLRTDPQARVLDAHDRPIAGLFACGNDMNSVMAGTYPSGGITLGPAMTFGYVVGRALAGKADSRASDTGLGAESLAAADNLAGAQSLAGADNLASAQSLTRADNLASAENPALVQQLRAAIVAASPVRASSDERRAAPQEMVDADFAFAAPGSGGDAGLRLWTNHRCIVASRGQTVMPHFDRARGDSDDAGWPVVTRRSGGTAVVHRPGILNVTSRQWLPRESQAWLTAGYEAFLKLLIDATSRLGVHCDHGPVRGSHCDGRFNLRHRGRKLAGTAAYSGVLAGSRYCVFHASITVSGSIEEDLAAITRFEHGLGLQRAYDTSAHVSLSELVEAGAGWTQPGFA